MILSKLFFLDINAFNCNVLLILYLSTGKRFSHLSADGKREIVEILETITYMVCQDNDVTQEDFHKILTSRNVPIKLFRAADQNGDGDLSIDEVMNFLVVLTKPTYVSYSLHIHSSTV